MFIIGELINGMYKQVGQAIKDKNKSIIQELAKKQVEAGASALDINCGPASKDPASDIKWLVECAQEVVDTSLCLDSTKSSVIEAGLSVAKQKAMMTAFFMLLEGGLINPPIEVIISKPLIANKAIGILEMV